MDLADWRDLTFTIFAIVSVIVITVLIVAAATVTVVTVRGLRAARLKLNESRPRIHAARDAAIAAESKVSKASDAVASPFIRVGGIVNAVKKGATTLVGGREGP